MTDRPKISMIMRIVGGTPPPPGAPEGSYMLTALHVGSGRAWHALMPADASDRQLEDAWQDLQYRARRSAGEPVDCRRCGAVGGHPALPGCPEVPLRVPGERSTRLTLPSAGRLPGIRPKTAPLTYARFQLLVDATHGVLVRDEHGAVWRDETRAPQYYTAPGRAPRRVHVTGKAQELQGMGWLVADKDGVLRLSVLAQELLAKTVTAVAV